MKSCFMIANFYIQFVFTIIKTDTQILVMANKCSRSNYLFSSLEDLLVAIKISITKGRIN